MSYLDQIQILCCIFHSGVKYFNLNSSDILDFIKAHIVFFRIECLFKGLTELILISPQNFYTTTTMF